MAKFEIKRTEVRSFKGIDTSRPIILDMRGKNVVVGSGDQGVGKTSFIEAIAASFGHNFKFDFENFINQKDGTIDVDQYFDRDGEEYRVHITKSKFELQRRNQSGKWRAEDEPKRTLRKLVGVVGMSPMPLREMDGDKQIEWFQRTFSADSEAAQKKHKQLKAELSKRIEIRRQINRQHNNLKKALQADENYDNREFLAKRFATPINPEKAKQRLDEAMKAVNTYEAAIARKADIERNISDIDQQIEALLAKKKELQDKLVVGEKFIKDNAKAGKEYEAAQKAWLNISNDMAAQSSWYATQRMIKDEEEAETLAIKADHDVQAIRQELANFVRQIIPDIHGLEVKIPDGIDDDEEGLFWHGKSMAQISESEMISLFCEIYHQKDVGIIILENITSFGNDTLAILNALAENGVYIYANQMDRTKDDLDIVITDKLS